MFESYFKVSFFGNVFGKEDLKTYIYCEKKLTHLFVLSKRILEEYKILYPNNEIELITGSGKVNTSNLNPEKGYIQVTFVEPYPNKTESNLRITSFEKSINLTAFYYETPFTKEGKNQGSIDKQWIKRTILTIKESLPSIDKRKEVISIKEKEFEPIRVAYRQLKERINMFDIAIKQKNIRQIQQLLHGSLLVQVNEGPSKMVEVFAGSDVEDSKYKRKLISISFIKNNNFQRRK